MGWNTAQTRDRRAAHRDAGFTLAELMVALAVMTILVTMGIPSFWNTVASSTATSRTNDLVGALLRVRSEAATRGEAAVLCASADGATCTGTWTAGWIGYVDADDSGAPNGDEVFLAEGAGDVDVRLDSGDARIDYDAWGAVNAAQTFRVCGARSSSAVDDRSIRLARSGRPGVVEEVSCP